MRYLLATLLLFLAACEICPEVDWEIKSNGNLACHGYDDMSTYVGEYCNIVSCTWFCASYNGGDCQYVDLTFTSCPDLDDDGSWRLDHSFTAECI